MTTRSWSLAAVAGYLLMLALRSTLQWVDDQLAEV